MMDSADPLSGWDFTEILKTNNGSATNDLYGKLSAHILATLLAFIQRLSSVGASFELYHMNAIELPAKLTPASFARIEVCMLRQISPKEHTDSHRYPKSRIWATLDWVELSPCSARSCKSLPITLTRQC